MPNTQWLRTRKLMLATWQTMVCSFPCSWRANSESQPREHLSFEIVFVGTHLEEFNKIRWNICWIRMPRQPTSAGELFVSWILELFQKKTNYTDEKEKSEIQNSNSRSFPLSLLTVKGDVRMARTRSWTTVRQPWCSWASPVHQIQVRLSRWHSKLLWSLNFRV